jgi:hypothetical protein
MEEAKSKGIFIARQLLRQNQLNFWVDLPTGKQAAVFQRLINGVVLEVCSTRNGDRDFTAVASHRR